MLYHILYWPSNSHCGYIASSIFCAHYPLYCTWHTWPSITVEHPVPHNDISHLCLTQIFYGFDLVLHSSTLTQTGSNVWINQHPIHIGQHNCLDYLNKRWPCIQWNVTSTKWAVVCIQVEMLVFIDGSDSEVRCFCYYYTYYHGSCMCHWGRLLLKPSPPRKLHQIITKHIYSNSM